MWRFTYTIKDEKSKRATVVFNVPEVDILTVADAAGSPIEYAQAIAQAIEPLIDGQITNISINIDTALPAGLKAAPLVTSDVEEGALFTFETADGFDTRARIPTFKESLITSGGLVNVLDSNVSEFLELIILPSELPADWSISASDARGANIVRLVSAEEKFKARRRVQT